MGELFAVVASHLGPLIVALALAAVFGVRRHESHESTVTPGQRLLAAGALIAFGWFVLAVLGRISDTIG